MNTPKPSTVFESNDFLLMRRNRSILAFMISPGLAVLILIVLGRRDASFLVPGALLSASFTYFAYRENWRPVCQPVFVAADPKGMTIGDRFIPRTGIRAMLASPGVAPRILIRRRFWFPIELQAENLAEARAFQGALGFDASQTFADFYGLSWIFTRYSYTFGALLALFVAGYACSMVASWGTSIGPAVLVLLLFFTPTRIRVGGDGVAFRWLWVSRFIGYGEIEDVTSYEEASMWMRENTAVGLRIKLRSGVQLVPMGMPRRWAWSRRTSMGDTTNVPLAWERIREAALVFRRRGAPAEASAGPELRIAAKRKNGDDAEAPHAPIEGDVE